MIRGDLSNRVIHLTSRETSAESPVLQDRVAITKFLSILYGRHLNGGIRNIRGGYRCVCFSEAPITVLARMLADRESRYAPLGVMVDKLWLFAQGGRPVIYQPEAEYEILPEALRYRHVRYEPDRGIDFSWEREWRLHADRLALNPAETTLVAPSRAIVDSLKAEHLENQRMAVYDLGEDAAYALQAFEWHFLVLDDLGLDVDFG